MKTKTQINIDKKVWWIPIKKIRDGVRYKMLAKNSSVIAKERKEIETKIIESDTKEQYEKKDLVKEQCRRNGLIYVNYGEYLTKIAQYYRKYPKEFMKDIEEFKKDMDKEDLEYLEYFINQVKYAPAGINIPYLIFDNSSLKLFSKEQEIVYFNEEAIYNELKKQFWNIDFMGLYLLYFKRGIFYLPEYIITKFKNTVCIDGGGISETLLYFLVNMIFQKYMVLNQIL